MPDLVAPSPKFVAMGFDAGQLALYFEEPSGLPVTFRLEARQTIGTGVWVRLNATLEGPDPQGRYRFLTTVPGAAPREWRVAGRPTYDESGMGLPSDERAFTATSPWGNRWDGSYGFGPSPAGCGRGALVAGGLEALLVGWDPSGKRHECAAA